MKKSRIGVLTGGGDCAGLNPALKWVVKTAMDGRLEKERSIHYEVLGIHDGWKGLIDVNPAKWESDVNITRLDSDIVRTWDRYGGTMLG
ncbi:MAG: 6-phosphofructokinase, partial [Dehalococcoidales bacterium]